MLRTDVGPFSVVEDRADPRVQVPVGATWRFSSRVTRTQRVILLKQDTSSWEGPKLVVQVAEPLQQDGGRVYPLSLLLGFLALATLGLTPGVAHEHTDWALDSAKVEALSLSVP